MNCSPADVNSGYASQEVPRLEWYWKISSNVYEIPILDHILCRLLSALSLSLSLSHTHTHGFF